MKISFVFLLLLLSSVFLQTVAVSSFAEETKMLSRDEQNKEALKAFEKILQLSESTDRANVLPQLEAAYFDIIRLFPDAYLTQESYWRVMLIYLTDYTPPAYAKAEALREEFLKKYPESKLRDLIDSTLAEAYYKGSQWNKLLKFYAPSIRKSIETGKFTRVADIFMYSEAKFQLNDFVEAEKGYKIVVATFPDARESAMAKKRLEEIQAKKPKNRNLP